MVEVLGVTIAVQQPTEGKAGATAAFPFDRLTVKRFRSAFPAARWREDLRAWFVPGTRAERRLAHWLGREMAGSLAFADSRGRDAYAFDPIDSRYLTAAEDLLVRTPFSNTVVEELRAVPWASWDPDLKAWRVPFRSWEDLRRRWPRIEAAAARNEPQERQKRKEACRGSEAQLRATALAAERRRHRYPVPNEALPPLDRVLASHTGILVFTEITGELVAEEMIEMFYSAVRTEDRTLVWASWRRPTLEELIKAWPATQPPADEDVGCGWWRPAIDVLRNERRRASSRARAREVKAAGQSLPMGSSE